MDVLLDALNVKCLVRNDKYDYEYCVANKKNKKKETLDYEKMTPFLFEYLGPNRGKKHGMLESYYEEESDKLQYSRFLSISRT